MYNVKNIEEAIRADFDGDWNEFLELVDDPDGVELPSLGVSARQVDNGGESLPWIVFEIGDQFFEKNGRYESYEGTDWDGGLQEVESYQELTTYYRPKK